MEQSLQNNILKRSGQKEIYQDNGENFYKEFDIQINSFDNTVLQHIEAFSIYYAKDSDAVPNCAE